MAALRRVLEGASGKDAAGACGSSGRGIVLADRRRGSGARGALCYDNRPSFRCPCRAGLAWLLHRIEKAALNTTEHLTTAHNAGGPRGAVVPAHARHFPVSTAELERIADAVLDAAKRGGATAAETEVSQAVGQSVTVRQGEVETIAYNRDKGIGVTVYVGQRRGHASTADFADDAIRAAVDKALAIARYTAEDPAAGLADPDRLAQRLARSRPLPSRGTLPVEAGDRARPRSRAAALAVDKRITNSEGATVARSESEFVYANTHGLRRRLSQRRAITSIAR